MALIGEGFSPAISGQVASRQKVFGAKTRSNSQLKYMNGNSAWIKLSSSVNVDAIRASNLGLQFSGEDVAKNYVLFGGTSKDSGTKLRSGLDEGYTVGGFAQGYRPQPGITSFETKNKNRGSLREATLNIKAFDTQQFNIIDVLYLRLGFGVLVEWGHSLYVDNSGEVQEITSADTLTSDFLNGTYNNDPDKLRTAITDKRNTLQGNYDAFYAKIVNFDWTYEADGSYNITLKLVSWGDIIESLKINILPKTKYQVSAETQQSNEENAQESETDKEFINYSRYKNSISYDFWNITNKQYIKTSTVSNNNETLKVYDNTFATEMGFSSGSDLITYTEFTGYDEERYYVRFGGFLHYLNENRLLYINKDKNKKLISIDTDENTNIIFTTPYVLSSDPRKCIVKSPITFQGQVFKVFDGLPKDFKTELEGVTLGKLMNVYLNFKFIIESIDSNKDDKGNTDLFSLLKALCDGINSSLGNLNSIEPSIDEDTNVITFIDETAIPNRDAILASKGKEVVPTIFEMYGYKENSSPFVTEMGIKTEITNQLATMLTIGAQANGVAVGEDATAFSKWNEGLTDRVKKIVTDSEETNNEEEEETTNNDYSDVIKEYCNFVTQMIDQKFDDSLDSFPDILSNFLNYKQGQESILKQTASTTLGFIPINLNLTFLGLSGIKIYQKFTVNSYFLPANYGSSLDFLIKGISHKVEGNRWSTTIESLSIPSSSVSTKASKGSLPYTSPPPNPTLPSTPQPSDPAASGTDLATAQAGLAGITPGQCGTKYTNTAIPGTNEPLADVRKTALQSSYNATFSNGEYISGYCGKYTYNHAFNYAQALRGGQLTSGATLAAGGNANQPTYWANLIKLGYTQTKILANATKAELRDYINNKITYNLGDVLVYWANEDPTDGSASQYGHTQMYIGNGNITEKQSQKGAPSGWTTDVFTNYGTGWVYNSKPYDCWNLLLFRAPQVSSGPNQAEIDASYLKYDEYVKVINNILLLKDNLYNDNPLLDAYSSATGDDVVRAWARIRSVFGLLSQNVDGNPAPWQSKYPISALLPDHQSLFKLQFEDLGKEILEKNNSFYFKYPDRKNPKEFAEDGTKYFLNPDY